MEQKEKAPVVISVAGLHGRRRKKEVKRVTREVTKDRRFKKAVRRASRRLDMKIPKELRTAAVRAAVEATLGNEPEHTSREKRSGLEVYTELVAKFAAARRKNKKRKKKVLKIAKKEGFDPATGLYALKKADKISLAAKAKPIKSYKPKKVKKS